ncbi:hypothetical protein [Pontibacter sp. G13]|uniref:hypothetical protein n=1 Tax=Pontibacter sp. G13 TaxID=3074898 RepID=UPI00288B7189|nr:hypothetical protein [Pontibacter sp. G13]WNJ17733.1 hypothetical protein RJD25_23015 [Pontibacter sp. G13]
MKYLSITACFLLWAGWVSAQSSLFIPFGQTAEEVKSYLDSRDYIVSVTEDEELQSLRVVLDNEKMVEYAFKDGALYATTVTRNYLDKKKGREIQKSCLDYMKQIGVGDLVQTEENKVMCYTTVTDSRIIKLFVQMHPKSLTLTLTAFSKRYGPMEQDENFYYEVEILQRKFISN